MRILAQPALKVGVAINEAHPHSSVLLRALLDSQLSEVTAVFLDRPAPKAEHRKEHGNVTAVLIARYLREVIVRDARSAAESSARPVTEVLQDVRSPSYDLPTLGWEGILDPLRAVDLVLMAGFSRIVPAEVLACPRLGWVNIHPSLLPEYRGSHPLFWALYDCQDRTGITAYQVEAGIDDGPIVAHKELTVAPHDTWDTLYEKAYRATPGLVEEVLRAARSAGPDDGSFPGACPQDHALSFWRSAPSAGDLRSDFTQPARLLACRIQHLPRRMWFEWRGERLIIVAAHAEAGKAEPGTVVSISDAMLVGTKEGILSLDLLDTRKSFSRRGGRVARSVGLKAGDQLE